MFRLAQPRAPLLRGTGVSLPFSALPSVAEGFGVRRRRALQELSDRIADWWARCSRAGRLVVAQEAVRGRRRSPPSGGLYAAVIGRIRRRLGLVQPIPRHRLVLLSMLSAGAALRAWFMVAYRPAFVGYPDARAYIMAARGPLYWNFYKPVGYPLLLRVLRALDSRLSFTVAVQHLLGIATAGLIYLTTVPLLRRRWLALLPVAVVLFGGSQVFLEHSVLSDGPYSFLLAIALYCAVSGLDGRRRLGWLAGAGAALGASVTLRTVGLFLLPVVAAWAGLTTPTLPGSARAALAVLAPAMILLVAYLIPQRAATGSWALTRSTNFALYARLAPLADCTRFAPPAGTAGLCEPSDPRTRPNANWYIFDFGSPAVKLYGVPPWPLTPVAAAEYRWRGDEPTGRFARAVLRHQPLDYLASVLEGVANYVVPRAGRASVFEYDQEILIAELRNPHFEQAALEDITAYYCTDAGYRRRGVRALEAYGRAAKTEGPLTAALAGLMLAGWALTRGRAHAAASLFASTSLSLAVAPVATVFYDVRYAAPMAIPLTAAAALGVDRLWEIVDARSGFGARDR